MARALILVDGENLSIGYRKFKEDAEEKYLDINFSEANDAQFVQDVFLWSGQFPHMLGDTYETVRGIYYTADVGDDPRLDEITDKIQRWPIQTIARINVSRREYLQAKVFKKSKDERGNKQKAKQVDVTLVTDMLLLAENDVYDDLYLFSGDTDFIPAIEAVQRKGKTVTVADYFYRMYGMGVEPTKDAKPKPIIGKLMRVADRVRFLDPFLLARYSGSSPLLTPKQRRQFSYCEYLESIERK